MSPLFTIHAGEYLVASKIEQMRIGKQHLRVWVPSKDTGIDLLVTSPDCKRTVALQIKFSKTYNCKIGDDAIGWWTINCRKLEDSIADYWVLVLPKCDREKLFSDWFFIVIPPRELLRRLESIHGKIDSNKSYKVIIRVRGKNVAEIRSMKKGATKHATNRDFSKCLNKLEEILRPLAMPENNT